MGFSQIAGHGKPISVLRRALRTRRIPHAYLFAGPKGLGKAFVAWNFARAIVCLAKDDDACDECESCKRVIHGNHPDVSLIAGGGSQIRIDRIREIQKQLVHRPLEGKCRVIIIDEAHDLNVQAANALLRVLEEPPEDNVIVLVARSTEALIPTIVSRCQVLHFVPLLREELACYLREQHGWGLDEANRISAQAQGNIGRALDLHDQPLLEEEMALLDLLRRLPNMNTCAILESAQKFAEDRMDAQLRLQCLQVILRDLVLMNLGVNSLDCYGLEDRLKEIASRWTVHDLLTGWHWVSEGLRSLERNYNVNLIMERILMDLFLLKSGQARDAGVPKAFSGE